MTKRLSVQLPDLPEMRDARVVDVHFAAGSEVSAGAVVLTVQIHDRTLRFKSPKAGRLSNIVPIATQPAPGQLLFSLIVAANAEVPVESVTEARGPATENTADTLGSAEEAKPPRIGARMLLAYAGMYFRMAMRPFKSIFKSLGWVLAGGVLAAVFAVATDGKSPIGGWVPETRITIFDGVIEKVSDAHIALVKRRHMAEFESDARFAELRERRSEREAAATDEVQDVPGRGAEAGEPPAATPKSTQAVTGSADSIRPCSLRDEACEPDVHILCQLKEGRFSGEDRWRNPVVSYMCAPKPVSFSNGMWRHVSYDSNKACRDGFGENAFAQSSFARNSGFVSSRENQNDAPRVACLEACIAEAAKQNKLCSGLL